MLGKQLDLRKAITNNANKMKNLKITTFEANFVRRMQFFLLKHFPLNQMSMFNGYMHNKIYIFNFLLDKRLDKNKR